MKHAAFLLIFLCAGQALAQAAPDPQKRDESTKPSAGAGGTVQADPDAARRLFRELDRNGDGYLSDDELWGARGRQENWAASDRDGDGRISPSEFIVLPPQ